MPILNRSQTTDKSGRANGWFAEFKRFFLFGSIVTVVGFSAMNFFAYALHLDGLVANILSLTISIAVGYFIDEKFVFRGKRQIQTNEPETGKWQLSNWRSLWETYRRRIIIFTVITLIGTYGLQTGLLELFISKPIAQNAIAGLIAPLLGHVSFDVIQANVMKMLAGIATEIFNFLLFRRLVFVRAD